MGDNAQEEQRIYIKKQVESRERNGENTSNDIISSDKKSVITVEDILSISSDSVVLKLNNLTNYGITIEQIETLYETYTSGNIETEEAALQVLKPVYETLATNLSMSPNGIVIDLSTGKKDIEASMKQKEEYGIESTAIIVYDQEKELFAMVDPKKSEWTKPLSQIEIDTEEIIIGKFNEYVSEKANNNLFNIDLDKNNEAMQKVYNSLRENGLDDKEIEGIVNRKDYLKLQKLIDIEFINKSYYFATKEDLSEEDDLYKYFEKVKDSKYFSEIVDDDGKVRVEKVRAFKERWQNLENEATLQDYLNNYVDITKKMGISKFKIDSLKDFNKTDLIRTLARGAFSENSANKKLFNKLCKNLGIGNSIEDIIKVADKYLDEPIKSEEDLRKLKEKSEINNENYNYRLKGMRKNIILTKEERIVRTVLDSLKETTTTGNYRKGENAVVVAKLYLKYSKEPEGKNVQKMIEKYMIEHKEFFGEYLKEVNNGKNITIDEKKLRALENDEQNKTLREKHEDSRTSSHADIMKSQIDRRLKRYNREKNSEKYKRKVSKVVGRIDDINQNNRKIPDEEMDKLFKKAVELELFDKLNDIENANLERFNSNMENVNKSASTRNLFKKGYFAIAHLATMPFKYLGEAKNNFSRKNEAQSNSNEAANSSNSATSVRKNNTDTTKDTKSPNLPAQRGIFSKMIGSILGRRNNKVNKEDKENSELEAGQVTVTEIETGAVENSQRRSETNIWHTLPPENRPTVQQGKENEFQDQVSRVQDEVPRMQQNQSDDGR